MIPLDGPLRASYQNLWDTMVVRKEHEREVTTTATKIYGNKLNYIDIANEVKIPWFLVGIIHYMECNLDFSKHLFNGDPLTARTKNYPPNMPKEGKPPFSFNYASVKALQHDNFINLTKDDIPRLLWMFEKYNGGGSRNHGINTPYLWSYTNHYTKGKYFKDGPDGWDPNLVSKQMGCAPLMRRLI